MKKFYVLFLLVVLVAMFVGCSSDIGLVKKQYFLSYSQTIPIGDALENYPHFQNVSWNKFTDVSGRIVVEVTCTIKKSYLDRVASSINSPNTKLLRPRILSSEKRLTQIENFYSKVIWASFIIQFIVTEDNRVFMGYIGYDSKFSNGETYSNKAMPSDLISIYERENFVPCLKDEFSLYMIPVVVP